MPEYIILIVFILILSPVFSRRKRPGRANIIFASVCFAVLFAVSVLRTGVGYDYWMYSQGFFKMGMDGFSTLEYLDWEWGFTLLTKIIVWFTRDIRIYMAVIALICLSGPFYLICRYSKKVWMSVLLYVNLYFFYCTMNYLRQSVAMSVAMFAYPFLVKRKIVPYMAIVLFASLFHITALIMIPVYFAGNFKPSFKVPILYGFLTLWVFISSIPALDIITEYIYSGYKDSIFLTDGLALIHILIPVLVLAATFFLLPKLSGGGKTLTVNANLFYFGCFFMAVMLRHAIFERLSYYAYIYVILYIPELTELADSVYKAYADRKYKALSQKIADGDNITGDSLHNGEYEMRNAMMEAALENAAKAYERRRKTASFCITAAVVAGTVAYNIYGLTVGDRGVHGVYPYQSWLYEINGFFGG